jgi:hypothetical protein
MHWLERAYEARDANLSRVYGALVFQPLHPDPRFQDLLRRMNLPVSSNEN